MKRETKEKLIAFAKTLDDLLEREKALTYLQKAPEEGEDGEKASPVYAVKAIPVEDISANTYNPNHVAPPEMKLLYDSIKEDGYTMPIVVYRLENGKYEIVDGYHRYTTMLLHKDIHKREGGLLPCSIIDKPLSDRMASTVRHNRARGTHDPSLMVNIVAELVDAGMGDAWILKHLGMDAEELLRLKQLSGLQELFKDREFSEAREDLE